MIHDSVSSSKFWSKFSREISNALSEVSSAKLHGCVLVMCKNRSLIYKLNSNGPNTDPWGTPVNGSDQVMKEEFTFVRCQRTICYLLVAKHY